MPKLLIECILKRPGGTLVELDGLNYHFKPLNDPAGLGRDVCFVENTKHAQRFMGIPEGYRLAEDAEPAVLTAPVPPAPPAPARVAAPPPAPDPTPGGVLMDPVTLPEPVPQTAIDANAPGSTQPSALPSEEELAAMDLEPLRAQAELELGRKPSPKAKEPLLISQILAIRADKGQAAT